GDFVGAGGATVVVEEILAELREILPRQRQHAWPVFGFERKLPTFGGFHRVAGAEYEKIWNGAQRGQMLDRLMRRPVFAQADRVMRHDVDDALAHQRGEANGRPAII